MASIGLGVDVMHIGCAVESKVGAHGKRKLATADEIGRDTPLD